MKKYQLITIVVLITISKVNAQVTPSPDALGSVNTESPADLYRGYVSEIVPLFSVTAENGSQVPIQLTYQTRGIKVNEVASSVGLGWNLSAGGAITRVMRDQPDDQSTFTETLTQAIVNADQITGTKGYDFEKDIFYISFPGGGGKFMSANSKMNGSAGETYYGLPYNDLDISFNKTSDLNSHWVVYDPQGVKYTFGSNSAAREITHSSSYEQGQSPKANEDWTYISTWYLEEIQFPDLPNTQDNKIRFTYTKNSGDVTHTSETSSKTYNLVEDHTVWRTWRSDGGSYFTIYNQWDEPNPFVEDFTNSVTGLDVGPIVQLPTSNWTLFDALASNCNQVDQCSQNYGSGGSFNPWVTDGASYIKHPFEFYNTGVVDPETIMISESEIETSRLNQIISKKASLTFNWSSRTDISAMKKLDGIDISANGGGLVHQVNMSYDYFDAGCGTASDCKRLKLLSVNKNGNLVESFKYMNDTLAAYNLPKRSSIKKDRYGYYNGSVTSKYEEYTFKFYNYGDTVIEDMGMTSVEKDGLVNYGPNEMTLGDTGNDRSPNLDAQANMLWKVNYATGAEKEFTYASKSSGGVLTTNVKTKNASGQLVQHHSYSFNSPIMMNAALHTPLALSVTFFSDSPYLGYDHLSIGGYYNVIVTDNMSGMAMEYDFYIGGVTDVSEKSLWNSSWVKIKDLPEAAGPLLPPPFNPHFGLPKHIKVRDANGAQISYKFFKYEYHLTTDYTFTESSIIRDDNGKFFLAQGDQKLRAFNLDYHDVINYEEGGSWTTRTEYIYHPTLRTFPSEIERFRVSNDLRIANTGWNDTKTINYYTLDIGILNGKYPNTSILTTMNSLNMHGISVASENWIQKPGSGYKMSGVSVTEYNQQHSLVKPYKLLSTEFSEYQSVWNSSSLTNLIETRSYDSEGRLISVLGSDGVTLTSTYDSDGYLLSSTVSPGGSLPDRTTTYTHKPLVGIATVTDPNGRTITNEYDRRNRLHLVKDQDNNIIKRYRYNIADEDNNISASIGISSSIKNQVIDFTTESLVMYGGDAIADFKWNIDGTEKSGKDVSHTFTSSGSKNITLNIINPEYKDPEVISTTLTIHDASWDAGAISGPATICLDGTSEGNPVYDGPDFYAASTINGGYTCHPGTANMFDWEYSYNQTSWTNFPQNTEPGIDFPTSLAYTSGNLYMRVKITDNCGVTKTSPVKTVNVTNASCGGGGSSCTISGSPTTYTFGGLGGSNSFTFTTTSSSYTITDNTSWLSVSNITSSTFLVTCQANGTENPRNGTITLSGSEGCSFQIGIFQDSGFQ